MSLLQSLMSWYLSIMVVYRSNLNSPRLAFFISGTLSWPCLQRAQDGIGPHVFARILSMFFVIIAMPYSVASWMVRRVVCPIFHSSPMIYGLGIYLGKFLCSPMPTIVGGAADPPSAVSKNLNELEEKLDSLCKKPFEMQQVLNATISRVDAIEAELISTKKVSLFCLI